MTEKTPESGETEQKNFWQKNFIKFKKILEIIAGL